MSEVLSLIFSPSVLLALDRLDLVPQKRLHSSFVSEMGWSFLQNLKQRTFESIFPADLTLCKDCSWRTRRWAIIGKIGMPMLFQWVTSIREKKGAIYANDYNSYQFEITNYDSGEKQAMETKRKMGRWCWAYWRFRRGGCNHAQPVCTICLGSHQRWKNPTCQIWDTVHCFRQITPWICWWKTGT